jgi:hypothetical protein|tara:strand:+ start:713 stop:1177 length:465 start_codon:yes stop_codon:yes gene_type:complete
MAEKNIANGKDQKILQHDIEEIDKKVEEVQQLELSAKDQIVASKSFIYVIIGLLVYLIFLVIPDMDERMTWMEKDLSAVLVQSERFKISTRVFARDNQCATCHLDPDHLLHNLQTIYPSFSDIKAFMRVGHMRYYTMTTPVSDEDLMEVYRTLK